MRHVRPARDACGLVLVFFGIVGLASVSSAATLSVCASGCAFSDLQDALDAAQPGDTIMLRAGETFIGNFVLREKANPTGASIVVRSDAAASALPPPGVRLIPQGRTDANTQSASLARLRGRGEQWKTTPVVTAAPGAHHYRIELLEIDGLAQEGWGSIVSIGSNASSQSTLAAVPYAISLDRVYIHGHPRKGQKRCLSLNGRDIAVTNSYIINCASFSTDSQAIVSFNGPGPVRIINNQLEGSGENVMFGGADPLIDNLVPSDIEIRRNHIIKPLGWRNSVLSAPGAPSGSALSGAGSLATGAHYFKVVAVMDAQGAVAVSAPSPERSVSVAASGSAVRLSWNGIAGADRYRVYRGTQAGGQSRYLETSGPVTSFTYTGVSETSGVPPSSGTRWIVKNLLELKNAQRVTIDGNVLEQSWAGSQAGYAILFTPRNQDGGAPWTVVRDVTLSNNIIRHAGNGISILGRDYNHPSQITERIAVRNNLIYDISSAWGPDSRFIKITQAPSSVTVDHNTVLHDGTVVLIEDGASAGFRFTNNLTRHNEYGIWGRDAGMGTAAIAAYFPGAEVRRNALAGGDAANYPPDNFFPDVPTLLAQFVNAAADDYRLVTSSSFRKAGTDGKDLGVDFAALAAAQGGSPGDEPDPTPSPSGPYGGTPVGLPGTIQAENFDVGDAGVAYFDSTSGNYGGKFRSTDVDIESTTDSGGGFNVGWLAVNEWMKYTVTVTTAGIYDLEARVSAGGAGGTFHIEVNGADKTGPLKIPDTGAWQNWVTIRKTGLTLPAGQQTWRIVVDGAGPTGVIGNLNFIKVTAATAPPPTGGSGPYGGTPVALPGTIQAENFDEGGAGAAYRDTTAGNYGGKYRTTDVDVENTSDGGGGYDVGWMAVGEWLNYSVNVSAAGTYDVELRVASSGGGGSLHLEVNGADRTGPLSIPDTGGWQTWTTIRKSGLSLSAGPQVFRVVIDAAGPKGTTANLNFVRVAAASTPPPTSGGDIVLHPADVTKIAGNWIRASYSSGAGGQAMQSADRGWSTTNVPRAAPADYFEAQFTPEANRAYHVWLRLRGGSNSKWNESVWVQFSGAVTSGGAALWRIGTTSALLVNLENCSGCGVSGWGWQDRAYWLNQSAVVRFPSTTQQTIRIQTREDGVILDQIVLSPATYFSERPGGLKNDATILTRTLAAVGGSTDALAVNLEDCSNCGVSGWGWQDNAWWLGESSVVRFASATPQTIRVQTREDGVEIDQIVLSQVTYFDVAPGTLKQDDTIVPK